MTDRNDSEQSLEIDDRDAVVDSRRSVLKLGALAIPAVATLSPSMAMAQTGGAAVSMMACTVPMPDMVDAQGRPIPQNKRHKIRSKNGVQFYKDGKNRVQVFNGPPSGSYSGQELKDALDSGLSVPPAQVDPDQFDAHVRYLTKVRQGEIQGAGMTCLVSLTNSLNLYNA
ncbi:MAG: hypothetical protein WA906_04165 [Pacificimonas sp.]